MCEICSKLTIKTPERCLILVLTTFHTTTLNTLHKKIEDNNPLYAISLNIICWLDRDISTYILSEHNPSAKAKTNK